MGSVLCVWRCAGVRRARAVYVCVLRSRARRVCCARAAGVCCVLCSVVRPVCAAGRRRLGWQGCAAGCGALRVVVRLPGGVRRPLSPPDRVVGGPGRGHAVCAACEAVCAAGAYVSVRRGTRVCVHAAGAGGRGGRRGLTAVRRPLVFCVTRRARKEALPHRVAAKEKKRRPLRKSMRDLHSFVPLARGCAGHGLPRGSRSLGLPPPHGWLNTPWVRLVRRCSLAALQKAARSRVAS